MKSGTVGLRRGALLFLGGAGEGLLVPAFELVLPVDVVPGAAQAVVVAEELVGSGRRDAFGFRKFQHIIQRRNVCV